MDQRFVAFAEGRLQYAHAAGVPVQLDADRRLGCLILQARLARDVPAIDRDAATLPARSASTLNSRSWLPRVSCRLPPLRLHRVFAFNVLPSIHTSASMARARSRIKARSLWFTWARTLYVGPVHPRWDSSRDHWRSD